MEKLINLESKCKKELLEIIAQQAKELSKKNEELITKDGTLTQKREKLAQKNLAQTN